MDNQELERLLAQFTGSEQLYWYSTLFRYIQLTDGVKYLADQVGCYWLIDLIGSHQITGKVRRETFQVWKVKLTEDGGCFITCDSGNHGQPITSQKVEYTDFPLDDFILYANWQGENLIIMLPQEY